jgi:hypothetical protein
MSLLSSFLASHLIPALESALLAHEPEEQEMILSEIKSLSEQFGAWLGEKLSSSVPKSE